MAEMFKGILKSHAPVNEPISSHKPTLKNIPQSRQLARRGAAGRYPGDGANVNKDQLKELESLRMKAHDLEHEKNLLLTDLEDCQKNLQALEMSNALQEETIERLGNHISQIELKCDQEKRDAVQIVKVALEDYFHKKLHALRAELEIAKGETDSMKYEYARMRDEFMKKENLQLEMQMTNFPSMMKKASEAKWASKEGQLAKQAAKEEVLDVKKLQQKEKERVNQHFAENMDMYKSELSSKRELACPSSLQKSHREELGDALQSCYTEILEEYTTLKAEKSSKRVSECDKEVVGNRRFMVGSVEVGAWDSNLVEESEEDSDEEDSDEEDSDEEDSDEEDSEEESEEDSNEEIEHGVEKIKQEKQRR